MKEIAEALEVLERMMDVGSLVNGIHPCMTLHSLYILSSFGVAGMGGGHVPGTSEVSPKLRFPVDGLVKYLQEKHGLFGNGR